MRGRKIDRSIIQRIQILRQKGFSLIEISNNVGIPKTTVFFYAKGIKILPEYQAVWKQKRGGNVIRKIEREYDAFLGAKKVVDNLNTKDKLLIITSVYLVGGNKRTFELSNSDPVIILIFVSILREIFHIKDVSLQISLRIHQNCNRQECVAFWTELLGLSKENIKIVDVLPALKNSKISYGICTVSLSKGIDLLNAFKGINKVIAENILL